MRAIVVLACIAVFAAVVSGADVEADKPRKPQRLVPPTVIKRNRVMPRTNVVIVPKGDPRARAPLPLDVMPPVVAVPIAVPVAPQVPVAVPVAPQVPAAVPVAPAAVPVVPAAVPAMGTNAAARDPVNAMGTNAATRDPVNAMGTNAATRDAAAAAVPAVVPPAVVPPAVVPPAVVPAAVPAQPQTPATPTPVLQSRGPLVLKSGVKNSAACAQRKGVCKASSSCSGSIVRGICPGNSSITCCVPKTAAKPSTPAKPATTKPTTTKPNTSKPATNTGSCPVYANAPVSNIKGNGGKVYQVVRIAAQHFSGSADNTMTKPTACAFARMAAAAASAGIRLTINSGFRTYERQVYFWNCYQKKNCNNGNRAARPGNSNHGRGQALDINTGGTSTKTYKWMAANAARFGFRRTVADEPWHWEH